MTLAFTQQIRASVGRKRFAAFSVTLDGATTAITANNLNMNYIESALVTAVSVASNIASYLCTTAGTSLTLGTTHASGDLLNLWVWGY